MLGTNVVVAQLQGFAQGELENLLGARGERNVAGGLLLALTNNLLHLLTYRLE